MNRRSFLLGMVALSGLAACNERPRVLPQGTPQEEAQKVRDLMLAILPLLVAGDAERLKDEEKIMLPSRWRRQVKQLVELEDLHKQLQAATGEPRLGAVHVEGRWALLESVHMGNTLIGKADLPWFFIYFAGKWHWLPTSIMRDPAIEGMMNSHFDHLWTAWQAKHGAKALGGAQ